MSHLIAKNKKAYFDLEILETFEAGIMLTGTEIKAIRNGSANLKGSYVTFRGSVPMLTNAHIGPYKPAGKEQHEPRRSRPLLLKATEIKKLLSALNADGVTAVPLELYFKGKWAKVLVGVGRGKKLHDKRRSIKERDTKRAAAQAVGRRR